MKKINIAIILFVLVIFSSYGQDGWTTEYLTIHKYGMGSAVVGSKVFFGSGLTSGGLTGKVEIYDTETHEWTYEDLAIARVLSKAVSSGSKVFFAGGMDDAGSTFDVIEIFDTATNQWSMAQLSQSVFDVSAVAKGNKVLFAGGGDISLNTESDKVDIYNTDTEEWTTDLLSEPRAGMGAAVVGDVALFAGGNAFSSKTVTDKVDIYNFSTGEWSMTRLSEARFGITAVTLGDKVFFAGGELANGELSNRIDIYDYTTNTWTIDSLSVARAFAGAGTICDKVYFVGGMRINPQNNIIVEDFNVIDIFNAETGKWSVEYLPYNLFLHSTISLEDQLFVAGGGTFTGEFIQLRKEVRIMTCIVGAEDLQFTPDIFTVYPNPTLSNFYITFTDHFAKAVVTISDIAGAIVYRTTTSGAHEIEVNTSDFAEGVYVVQLQTREGIQSQKIVVAR